MKKIIYLIALSCAIIINIFGSKEPKKTSATEPVEKQMIELADLPKIDKWKKMVLDLMQILNRPESMPLDESSYKIGMDLMQRSSLDDLKKLKETIEADQRQRKENTTNIVLAQLDVDEAASPEELEAMMQSIMEQDDTVQSILKDYITADRLLNVVSQLIEKKQAHPLAPELQEYLKKVTNMSLDEIRKENHNNGEEVTQIQKEITGKISLEQLIEGNKKLASLQGKGAILIKIARVRKAEAAANAGSAAAPASK